MPLVGLYGKIEYTLEGVSSVLEILSSFFNQSEFENKLAYWICAWNNNNDKETKIM